MKRSIQSHLTRSLALAILVAGIVATAVSFYFSYGEAEEFQDDALRQVAILNGAYRHGNARLSAADNGSDDEDSLIRVIHLPQEPKPVWMPHGLAPGFHTLNGGEDVGVQRVYVREAAAGNRIAVFQSTESRDEIAMNSALRTLIPLLILLPILAGLIVQIVRSELKPVKHLSDQLDNQLANQLSPLPVQELPAEIVPFVQAINRLLGRANILVAEQRRFVADASHELRTPLAALSFQAQNLARAHDMEAVQERLVPLRAGIDRAQVLTAQLLDLARLQAGEEKKQRVQLSALAREIVAELLPVAEARHIDLGLEDLAPPEILADTQSVRLIVFNALDNALKYTPEGGTVTLRLQRLGDDAVIDVADNGPGIPPAEREQVFNPFHRVENTDVPGSGLGLAIVREAAARLGGQVSLMDNPQGRGLVFRYVQRMAPPEAK